ncbi:peptide-methionine (R)-S-oxide reductase MsrB [Echinicola jeungdonensis]|uniref:peptide-methionine (R)-S-oxide reductase n=1 Tax=Echinicola jeungdonensis TaxID=709343 RepID=A0ABV5J701_9BACT|nr:peptide-methionine (R)-S-oxide reductase MsrB [Echinicola jeungdonensis]MDN3670754.1 peptide-methionine (R)-S-oxide reductase MsrB [Echinicola jeungdonensis]
MKKSDHTFNIQKSDEEWKSELDPQEYHVLIEKGTERAFTGKYNVNKENGIYTCAACGHPIFKSTDKYDSGSGWPSFTEPYNDSAIVVEIDKSLGMIREEVLCANCGGHLGHRFPDGPEDKGGIRYCINSVSMDFEKKDDKPE